MKISYLAVIAAAGMIHAQPPSTNRPRIDTVVNAASFASGSLENGALTLKSVLTIFGENLADFEGAPSGTPSLPETFRGITVSITFDGPSQAETYFAPILYVSPRQINAQLPEGLRPTQLRPAPDNQTAHVSVFREGAASEPFTLHLAKGGRTGIFTLNGSGSGAAIAWQQDYRPLNDPGPIVINSPAEPARAGQLIQLAATGAFFAYAPADPLPGWPATDSPISLPLEEPAAGPALVFGDGLHTTRRLSIARFPGLAGIDRIAFLLPDGLPPSCALPVRLITNGLASPAVTISIGGPAGGPCQADQ